jgi:outer membrane protein assembly factor BamB
MRSVLTSAFVLATAVTAVSQGTDWNQWRGANRDGVVAGFTAPATWPDRPKQLWKVPAGIGHSSPVISGARVFQFARVGEQEALTALEAATGKQIWRQTYEAPYAMNPAATSHGKGPKSTPVVDRGRVFTLGISGILSAFDAATGKLAWRHDFRKDFKSTSPDFGTAMSPIIDGDHLIAHVGGAGDGPLIAFSVSDGTRRWAWKGDGPSYASPIIATLGGVRHVITQSQRNVIGLSPGDGRELWRLPLTTDYDQNIVTPLVSGGMLIYGGLSQPTMAVRLTEQGGVWKPQQQWQNADVPMYMSSPVVGNGVLYGFTHRNRGQFFALDVASGKTLWTSPPRQGDNAALTIAAGLLIATTTDGKVVVMRQGRSYELVREYAVADSPIWAHPAFHARSLIVKDAETLSAWAFGG